MSETGTVVFDLDAELGEIAAVCHLPQTKVRAAAGLLAEGKPSLSSPGTARSGPAAWTRRALRAIEDAISYRRELADRKNTILSTIEEQGKLDDALRRKILDCGTRRSLRRSTSPTSRSAKPGPPWRGSADWSRWPSFSSVRSTRRLSGRGFAALRQCGPRRPGRRRGSPRRLRYPGRRVAEDATVRAWCVRR